MKGNTFTFCEIGYRQKMMEKLGLWQFTYVIVTVYFVCFERFIVYKNTNRPRYVSKKAQNCSVQEVREVS